MLQLHVTEYKEILYQSRIFKQILRASRMQLRSSNVSGQWVFMYLKRKSGPLRGSCNPQVRWSSSFWQYEEMRDTHRSSNIQKVPQIIPFLFLKKRRHKRIQSMLRHIISLEMDLRASFGTRPQVFSIQERILIMLSRKKYYELQTQRFKLKTD